MSDNGTRVTRRKLSDYTPDPHNANRGTERGVYMLDRSIEEVGLARSIVAAADGSIPAGNKTLQAAADAGIEDVIEVETDGRALVVVKRTDWPTVDAEQARKYAYYDNRASEVDLDWDVQRVLEDIEAGIDLSGLFHKHEIAEMEQLLAIEREDLDEIASLQSPNDLAALDGSGEEVIIKVALAISGVALLERAIQRTGLPNRRRAFEAICRAYLDEA